MAPPPGIPDVLPSVRDITTYLRYNAWRQSATWRGASVWAHADGYEVLVPPRDDLADSGPRVRELLSVLTAVERRPAGDIAMDIGAPLEDVQSFRTFPAGMPSGYTSLDAGISALRGVHSLIAVAARTAAEGPRPEFSGRTPADVSGLLRRVRLGPGRPGSYIFTVRIPVEVPDDDAPEENGGRAEPLGRQTARQLHEAVIAVRDAAARAETDGLAAFDDTVTAGVSANLCQALSALAGHGRAQAFEMTFRWGRGLAPDPGHPAGTLLPASTVRLDTVRLDTVRFAEGTGRTIHAAAAHLRRVRVSGAAEVTGYVESLHDQPETGDRWRIKVRGDLTTAGGGTGYSRSVWIRLDGQDSYGRAIAAHRDRLLVRARGDLSASRGRVELTAGSARFEVIG
jgi:hypothetical protein